MAKAEKKQVSLEAGLWNACNKLRGSVTATDYVNVVLGLLFLRFAYDKFKAQREKLLADEETADFIDNPRFYSKDNVFFLEENDRWNYIKDNSKDIPHNCAQTIHIISADPNFEKKCNSSALCVREISLVTQPSFDCEQGINSQVQTACSNADAVFPVLGIVFCKNERFSLSRKTHVPLWNESRISHVRLL